MGQVGPFIANMTVEGPVSAGNPGGNPVLVGGIDGSGNTQPLKATAGGVMAVRLEDGTGAALATVAQFHNADNQNPGGTANGVLTGGVAQLVNAGGNLDRQTETWADNRPNLGIATGANQNAMPIGTVTISGSVTGSSSAQTVTLSNVTGTVRGVTWTIQAGHILQIGGANPENVYITAVNVGAKTVTGIFLNNHSNGDSVTAFVYNQQRDATLADGASPAGVNAGAAYFWNGNLNGGTGGMEIERSANGELDNASGAGTAVAAEYEYTNVGFDRARNLQGKGLTQATITATAGGDTSLTFSADPSTAANGGLKAGQYLLLSTGLPSPLTGDWVQVASTYVSGTSVPIVMAGLTTSVTAGRTRASFSSMAYTGPTTSGFLADGVGLEEEAIYNPVDGLYYIERSATQDGMAAPNIVAECEALYNGSTFDRARSNMDITVLASAARTATTSSASITNYNGKEILIYLNVTTASGTGGLQVRVLAVDPVSGNGFPLGAQPAAITATGQYGFVLGPACTTTGGSISSSSAWALPLPRTFQIQVTHGDGSSYTYSVGATIME